MWLRFAWVWLILLGACATAGSGAPGGVQAKFAYAEGRALRVVNVPNDGAAFLAGLRVNDRVIQIDSAWVSDLTMQEAVDRLRGPIGSHVQLKVRRGEETLTFKIERSEYAYRRY